MAGDLIMFYRYLIDVLQQRFDDSIKMCKNFSTEDFKIDKLKKKNYCTQLSCELLNGMKSAFHERKKLALAWHQIRAYVRNLS